MEQWKNNVLDSLTGMKKAKPTHNLFSKIKDRIENQKQEVRKEPKVAWLSVAAVILVVICSNLVIIGNYFKDQEDTPNTSTTNFEVNISRDYNIYQL